MLAQMQKSELKKYIGQPLEIVENEIKSLGYKVRVLTENQVYSLELDPESVTVRTERGVVIDVTTKLFDTARYWLERILIDPTTIVDKEYLEYFEEHRDLMG